MRVNNRNARPTRPGVDPLEGLVPLVVGYRADCGLRFLGETHHEIDRWGNTVPNQQDARTGLESSHRLIDVADRKNPDAVESQALECVLQRLWNALDD